MSTVAFELDTALKLPSVDCDAPGVDRFHFEGVVSDADLNDYYLPVFERPLSRARPAAIMCSFASVNGVP